MRSITVQLDAEAQAALATLTADGTSQSAAIREAILDAYDCKRSAQPRTETAPLAADPEDQAEARAVLAELDSPPLREVR
ncbi:MAG: hypothetical protein JWO79_4570 [Actinomycetia bacterium]|jgi:hypothetical protein|nr:hypothetical protein [Actinomycetes bacterium]MDQ1652980.1 hypothetical protein [Cryptosporangiaceae bacterium]MDQ1657654.1 hypothetical protein [Cryptosporangiaceae bacterium]